MKIVIEDASDDVQIVNQSIDQALFDRVAQLERTVRQILTTLQDVVPFIETVQNLLNSTELPKKAEPTENKSDEPEITQESKKPISSIELGKVLAEPKPQAEYKNVYGFMVPIESLEE